MPPEILKIQRDRLTLRCGIIKKSEAKVHPLRKVHWHFLAQPKKKPSKKKQRNYQTTREKEDIGFGK
jgi:hypothetical protein